MMTAGGEEVGVGGEEEEEELDPVLVRQKV